MGVDCTIFIVASYSRDVAYGDAMIHLDRDRDLFPLLGEIAPVGRFPRLQVMQGSWGCDSEGNRLPDDRESGYLFGDSYAPDAGFDVMPVSALRDVPARDRNKQIIDMICSIWPDDRFILIFH